MKIAVEAIPLPPFKRPHKKIEDVRARFADISAKTPVDRASRVAFMQSKVRLAYSHPAISSRYRDLAMKSVTQQFGPQLLNLFGPPIPGGVGYGVFYKSDFKTNWGRGTSCAFDLIVPTPPGGNVDTWLYLTAMNRSALGLEAFISYNGQDDTHFKVFDWSRDDHWQTDIPLSDLSNYLMNESAHGNSYQVLPVWNSTWQLDGTNWRNQALLYNHVSGGWDLVYEHDYPATDEEQKTGFIGSWAPIVETFQPLYLGTNPFGALRTHLISADASGHWGAWNLLSPEDSEWRVDNQGFCLTFSDPNHAFATYS